MQGNVLTQLGLLPDGFCQTCITSPPYWGLRDYKISPQIWDGDENGDCKHEWGNEMKTVNSGGGWFDPEKRENYPTMRLRDPKKEKTNDVSQGNFCQLCNAWRGSLGLEPTPELFVQHIVEVFREVRRVLRDDGTLWLNLGDSYAGSWGASGHTEETKNLGRKTVSYGATAKNDRLTPSCKPKDLVGIPWMVAFALRDDGWYLRSDIIWHKPNPMPESVTDRPTKAHEYLFLLSKSKNYYYDADAIKEKAVYGEDGRKDRVIEDHKSFPDEKKNSIRGYKTKSQENGQSAQHHGGSIKSKKRGEYNGKTNDLPGREAFKDFVEVRNKRTVWTVATQPYKEAHFATYPEALITPCILAGAPEGGIVLDPFFGSGTTGAAAKRFGRKYIGIELSEEYITLAEKRIAGVPENLFA